ncbi:Folylpolyglutamate synthase [Rosistilla carotiformis]|uniref:Dihydrofolate synthase/folylpolyglutamate synthase n=1 Tax=Rosistilla carotiformis TaxID=2528017 RepID=A0A518JUG8_9BACT|nr:folylpolyglutamate synthase/dihydrofolate synthase family protein [Rosistilla carotiformis]QDV69175.1 Folylpolyglutamate synthase [Rosistilla carotiformis]
MTQHDTNMPDDQQALSRDGWSYSQSLDYLYGRINYERLSKPSPQHPMKLVRMHALLSAMGNPQSNLKIVHIAGTKGKGSTASMVAAMATQSGLRCGLYTSPHLEALEERFRVDGEPATQSQMIALIDCVRTAADTILRQGEGEATFFELTTAIAIEHFRRVGCEVAVLEVGLGGRLDSTNVCSPAVTAITSIGLDHQHLLGDTVQQIAAEKAGIIKPGIPVVSGVRNPEAAAVIRQIAEARQSPLVEIDRDFSVQRDPKSADSLARFDFLPSETAALPLTQRTAWPLALAGIHQVRNAGVALAIADCWNQTAARPLQFPAPACQRALGSVSVAGRIEFFPGQPTVILDTAHNRDSIEALGDVLGERFEPQNVVAVFGTSHDKDVHEMLSILSRHVKQIVLTRYRTNPRWYPPQELATIASQVAGQSWEVVENSHDALQVARHRAGNAGVVVICGSFFLAAELRRSLVENS